MKTSVNVTGHREVALKNIEEHMKNHAKAHEKDKNRAPRSPEEFEAHEKAHLREVIALKERIKANAKHRIYLGRRAGTKAVVQAEPTPA